MKKLMLFAASTMIFAACGSDKSSETTSTPATQETSMVEEEPTTTHIQLEGDDNMKFNATSFTVPVGQEITLTLKHVGTQPKETMGHNVVILKQGENFADYGNEAGKAKDEDYMPKALKDKTIAQTALIGGGETTEIKFTITEAGDYPFLCSFPGHYANMKGIITAK